MSSDTDQLTCLLVAFEYSNTENTRCSRDMCLHLFFRMAHIKNETNLKLDLGSSFLKKFTSKGTCLFDSNQTSCQVNFSIIEVSPRKIELQSNEHIFFISAFMFLVMD